MVNPVDLTEEHTSGMSHTSKYAGDSTPFRNGSNHDEVSNYLAVDHVVFTKELAVRDSESGIHESPFESGRPEEPVTEIVDDQQPLRRRSPSRRPSQTMEDCGRRQSHSPNMTPEGRSVPCQLPPVLAIAAENPPRQKGTTNCRKPASHLKGREFSPPRPGRLRTPPSLNGRDRDNQGNSSKPCRR